MFTVFSLPPSSCLSLSLLGGTMILLVVIILSNLKVSLSNSFAKVMGRPPEYTNGLKNQVTFDISFNYIFQHTA